MEDMRATWAARSCDARCAAGGRKAKVNSWALVGLVEKHAGRRCDPPGDILKSARADDRKCRTDAKGAFVCATCSVCAGAFSAKAWSISRPLTGLFRGRWSTIIAALFRQADHCGRADQAGLDQGERSVGLADGAEYDSCLKSSLPTLRNIRRPSRRRSIRRRSS